MSTKKAIYTLLAIIAFVCIVETLLSTRAFMWLLRLSFEGDEKSQWLHCFPPLSRSHRVEEEGRRLGRARTAPTFILQSSPPPGGGDGAENYGDGGDGGEKYGDGNQDQSDWGRWQINLAEFCSHSQSVFRKDSFHIKEEALMIMWGANMTNLQHRVFDFTVVATKLHSTVLIMWSWAWLWQQFEWCSWHFGCWGDPTNPFSTFNFYVSTFTFSSVTAPVTQLLFSDSPSASHFHFLGHSILPGFNSIPVKNGNPKYTLRKT